MMATETPAPSTLNTMHGLGIFLPRPNAPPLRPPNPFNLQTPRPTLARLPVADPAEPKMVSLRSTTGMEGLLAAESGAGMVQLDYSARGSGFKAGGPIAPGSVTPAPKTRKSIQHLAASLRSSASLERQPTLFTRDASPHRNAAELKSVLGAPASGKLQTNATVIPPTGAARIRKRAQSEPNAAAAAVVLEQAKPKARVELDVILESETCVEGGYMKGYLQVKIRKGGKNDGPVYLGGGKIRVVGFEAIPQNDDRHTFYQHSAPLSEITTTTHLLYTSAPDQEGFCRGREGTHTIPFAMELPASGGKSSGAKGSLQLRNGASVRYISMASIRIKDGRTGARSIAHFYRNIEVWPSYDPSRILAPTPSALYSTAAKPVFMGGSGKLKLTASIHREIWVAGQRCYVKVFIANDTTKKMKNVTLSLIRVDTIFRPNPDLNATSPTSKSADLDADACQTSTTRKVVTETMLEMASKGTSGYATAKGWWTGVEAGSSLEFVHYILLPPDAISMTRSRLLEVSYFLRVTVGTGALSSEVSVQLPIRVINFISIDPIPSFAPLRAMLPTKRHTGSVATERQRSRSMDDVREIRLTRAVFGSGVAAPGVGIIASDGTYRGDTTLHPIGRLEVRNLTPPEELMRRAAEQRLQGLVPELGTGTIEEPRYPHDPATMKSAVADGGEMQGELVELQSITHAREPQACDSVAHTPYFGDPSIEGSQERQQVSPEIERGGIPLTAYSSTATQRMYNVSQETSHRGPFPNPSASAYPRDQPPTSLSPGDTIDGNITSDEEVDMILGSVNPGNDSNMGAFQEPGVEVERETPERQPNNHVFLQEGPLRKSPALSRGPFDVSLPGESISTSTNDRRPWQVGSQPLPTRVRQQSSVSTVVSSMQSSRATSMASGVDIPASGPYPSHDSAPGPKIGGPRPAQGPPAWGSSAPNTRMYTTPKGGRAVIRTSHNVGPPVKGGPGGLVLQPRPLPTSRTTARRSMVEGGLRTRTFGLKAPPPGSITHPFSQQARSSDRGTASGSPSRKPEISSLRTADSEHKEDSNGPHPCNNLNFGEGTASFSPETLRQATPSEDPHFIPPTVSALMRTDIQPGNVSTSVLRGPRPVPERHPTRHLKGEAPLEGISRSAPPLLQKWENNNNLTYLQQLDTTPTPPSTARLSMTSTPSKAFPLGPTSVKSRIAMLEGKTKTLDSMSGTVMSGRLSATSVGKGISSGQSSVRPLSNSSAVTFESQDM